MQEKSSTVKNTSKTISIIYNILLFTVKVNGLSCYNSCSQFIQLTQKNVNLWWILKMSELRTRLNKLSYKANKILLHYNKSLFLLL